MKRRALLKSTLIVGIGTAASRALGFVREMLMAWLFGTSLAKSAFDVAFRIPNLFRRLLGEGALSAAFVPVLTEVLQREGPEAAGRLVARVATLLAATLGVVVGLGMLLIWGMEQTLPLGPRAAAVLPLLRIMLPYTLFICLAALAMGVLHTRGYFAVPALAPVVLNLVWTAALLWVCPRLGNTPDEQILALAWCIVLAGALQLFAQVPMLRRCGIRLRWSADWRHAHVRRILMLMAPAALGLGVYQLNTVIDGVLALFVGAWAPAALTYAERLIYLPLGVIATALGTVLLPAFSRQAAEANPAALTATLRFSLCAVLLVMTPAAAGLAALAEPIVRLSFLWKDGLFDAESTLQTTRAVVAFAPGLIVFSLYKVLVPAFYALQDVRYPVRIGLWAVGLNLALNLTFIATWPRPWAHAGLAFATVLSSGFNCVLLARGLQRRLGDPGWAAVARSGRRALAGAVLMGALVWWGQRLVETACLARGWADKPAQVASVGAAIAAGLAVYGLWLALVSREDLHQLWQARRRRGRPA